MWKIKIILLILHNRKGKSWASGYKSRPFLGIVIFPLSTEQGDTDGTGRSVAVALLPSHPLVGPGGPPSIGRKMNPGPCSKHWSLLRSIQVSRLALQLFVWRLLPGCVQLAVPTQYAWDHCSAMFFLFNFINCCDPLPTTFSRGLIWTL